MLSYVVPSTLVRRGEITAWICSGYKARPPAWKNELARMQYLVLFTDQSGSRLAPGYLSQLDIGRTKK